MAGQKVFICDKAKVEVSVAKQSKIRVIAMLLLETLDQWFFKESDFMRKD